MISLEEETRRAEKKFFWLVFGAAAILLILGWAFNHAGDGHGVAWGAHGARQQMMITHEGHDIVMVITQYGEPTRSTSSMGPIVDRTTVIFPVGGEVHEFLLNELQGGKSNERRTANR